MAGLRGEISNQREIQQPSKSLSATSGERDLFSRLQKDQKQATQSSDHSHNSSSPSGNLEKGGIGRPSNMSGRPRLDGTSDITQRVGDFGINEDFVHSKPIDVPFNDIDDDIYDHSREINDRRNKPEIGEYSDNPEVHNIIKIPDIINDIGKIIDIDKIPGTINDIGEIIDIDKIPYIKEIIDKIINIDENIDFNHNPHFRTTTDISKSSNNEDNPHRRPAAVEPSIQLGGINSETIKPFWNIESIELFAHTESISNSGSASDERLERIRNFGLSDDGRLERVSNASESADEKRNLFSRHPNHQAQSGPVAGQSGGIVQSKL